MSRHVTFRQADVQRAVKAAQAVGLCVKGVEIAPDGTIRVLTGKEEPQPLSALERWEAETGDSRAA